jgi:branched-chain amino acid transport system substrate-binding protein
VVVAKSDGRALSLDRRKLLGLFAGAGLAGLTGGLSGCSNLPGSSSPKGTVRIGMLVPRTGVNKAIGSDLEKGFNLYLEMNGGLLSGHQVELIVEDEGDTIQSGTDALKSLHGKNVLAVTGVANSDLLPQIRDIVEKSQVPLIAAHGSNSDMSSAVYIWRTAFVNNEPGRAVGLYLKGRNAGRVGRIGLPDNFTTDAMGGLEKEYSNVSDCVWLNAGIKADSDSFSGPVQSVLSSGPDVIFCSLPPSHVLPFLDALRRSDKKIDVYAPGLVSETLTGDQLKAAGGLYTAMQYSSDLDNPANRSFSAQYQQRYQGSPTAFAVAAYDAAAVLDGAIALCGDDSISALRINQEIPNVGQVISPRGNWQFNQARSPQQKWYLRQIRPDGPIWSNVLIGDLATLG